jgi:hypothetical protein
MNTELNAPRSVSGPPPTIDGERRRAHASADKIGPTYGLLLRPNEDNDAVFILNVPDDTALQHCLWDMTLIVGSHFQQ